MTYNIFEVYLPPFLEALILYETFKLTITVFHLLRREHNVGRHGEHTKSNRNNDCCFENGLLQRATAEKDVDLITAHHYCECQYEQEKDNVINLIQRYYQFR